PPPLPMSTLFPYTTLFRSYLLLLSDCRRYLAASDGWLDLDPRNQRTCALPGRRRNLQAGARIRKTPAHYRTTTESENSAYRGKPDRKSTRLNSSHVKISYA